MQKRKYRPVTASQASSRHLEANIARMKNVRLKGKRSTRGRKEYDTEMATSCENFLKTRSTSNDFKNQRFRNL